MKRSKLIFKLKNKNKNTYNMNLAISTPFSDILISKSNIEIK